MVSIPRSICSLRGCKIPFPNLFDFVLFRPRSEFFEEEEPKLLFSLLSAATTSVSRHRDHRLLSLFLHSKPELEEYTKFSSSFFERRKKRFDLCRCKIQFYFFISKRDVVFTKENNNREWDFARFHSKRLKKVHFFICFASLFKALLKVSISL